MRQIVVLGCGFAGYHAAHQLEEGLAGRRRVKLTVVSRRAHFVFSPLLTSLASGELDPDQIITPIDDAFGLHTDVVVDHVEEVDLENRCLICEHRSIPFDYLLIASGGISDPRCFEGADSLLGPDTLTEAIAIGTKIKEALSSGEGPYRFTIIGGSTTGVEWAAELATSLAMDHGLSSHDEGLTIELIEAGPRLLPDHSLPISELVTSYLDELGVKVRTDLRVASATPTSYILDEGSTQEATLVFHCAGRVGVPLWKREALSLDERGRIVTERDLQARDMPGIYVAGDAASPLEDVPKTSNPQIARQQGQWAARNLLADMTGRSKKPFSYEDRGDFVTLGRTNAALELRGLLLEGKAAWLANRLYYTALIPRAFQKARLLMDLVARRAGTENIVLSSQKGLSRDIAPNENDDEDDSSSS